MSSVTDFETIILTNDENMGEISALNPFDKEVIVEQTINYLRQHLYGLRKAINKFNDQSLDQRLDQILTNIETELQLSESIFQTNPDLKIFHIRMAFIGLRVMEIQRKVIDKLINNEGLDQRVVNNSMPLVYRGRHISDDVFDLRIHELWKHLKDFTIFIEDFIDDDIHIQSYV